MFDLAAVAKHQFLSAEYGDNEEFTFIFGKLVAVHLIVASFYHMPLKYYNKTLKDKTKKNIDRKLILSNAHKTNFHNAWPVITDEVSVNVKRAVYLRDLDKHRDVLQIKKVFEFLL